MWVDQLVWTDFEGSYTDNSINGVVYIMSTLNGQEHNVRQVVLKRQWHHWDAGLRYLFVRGGLEDGQRSRLELYVLDVERPITNVQTEVEDIKKIECENSWLFLSKLPTAKETAHLIIQNVFFIHGPSKDIILDQAFSVVYFLKALCPSMWDTSSQKLFFLGGGGSTKLPWPE